MTNLRWDPDKKHSHTKALKHWSARMSNIHILADIIITALFLLSLPSVFLSRLYLSFIIPPFSLPARLSVRLCAVFNMLRGHMSTLNNTEQIRYFVYVHSSFGQIHVLAILLCHAW